MGLNNLYEEEGAILTDEEKEGLKIKTITTRDELNQFEQKNIEQAYDWLLRKKISLQTLLSIKFINDLHRHMLGQVWVWAGQYRRSNKNIGVDKAQISSQVFNLLGDCQYWIDNKTFAPEEIAIRFSHQLVRIHPFSNGNGRHSRLIADLMMERVFNKPKFSWSFNSAKSKFIWRQEYYQALARADEGDYQDLLKFVQRD